ncbi:low-density lipoprotein receptor class A domain-containing protein 2, partial [Myotis daubentonii]|uniref:low-density lipoprotein receptor class A domain-containing protein 2 n=1 Tax=Myotis daubentonii TaxID=98922 RepID=UPI002872E80F
AEALTILGRVRSTGEFLGLRLVTRGRQPCVDFVGEVTSFLLGGLGLLFLITCIPPSLVCDLWGMDNCGDSSDQEPSSVLAVISHSGPSLMPSQEGSTEADTSRPPTVCPALGSAGPLQSAAGSSPPAGRGPAQQDAAAEGRWSCYHLPPLLQV